MNGTLTQRLQDNQTSQETGWALAISIGFHITILVLAIVGLPHITKPVEMDNTPIPVEILPIDEMTTTNKPPVQSPPKEQPPEEKPLERKQAEVKPPAPPKVDALEPPKAVPPEPPKEEAKPAPKPKPTVPPPQPEKLEKVEEKPPEPEPDVNEEVVDNSQQFESLLKNLQDSEPEVTEEAPVNPEAETPAPSPLAAFSQKLTMSESDALRQQLSQCWSIQAGARYAEDLVVELRLTVNRDRTVQGVVIQDRWRYSNDPAFRAAADSAQRAVLSPMCTPLNLPPEKYDSWKDIIVNFDPRDML